MLLTQDNQDFEVKLEKTKCTDGYSGARASYNVFVNDIKVGELRSQNSRIGGKYHKFFNNKNKSVGGSVSPRGVFRKHLNRYAVLEYLEIQFQ